MMESETRSISLGDVQKRAKTTTKQNVRTLQKSWESFRSRKLNNPHHNT
jgi:hypothetical protein